MSTLYIRQYTRVAHDQAGQAIAAGLEPGKDTTLSIGGTTANVALATGTKFVRLHTDAICNFNAGTSAVTATTSNARRAAKRTEFCGISAGATPLPENSRLIARHARV